MTVSSIFIVLNWCVLNLYDSRFPSLSQQLCRSAQSAIVVPSDASRSSAFTVNVVVLVPQRIHRVLKVKVEIWHAQQSCSIFSDCSNCYKIDTFDNDINGTDFFISLGSPANPPMTKVRFAPPSSSPLYTTFEKSLDEYSDPFSSRAMTEI